MSVQLEDVESDLQAIGIEVYLNDEPDDPNPGLIVDTRDWQANPRALTASQAQSLAVAILVTAGVTLDE